MACFLPQGISLLDKLSERERLASFCGFDCTHIWIKLL